MSELQDDQPDHAQSPQPGPAAASFHQSDLKNDHPPKQLRRRSATGNVNRKRPRTTAPIRLASTASTVSAALESADLEEAPPHALTAAPVRDQERELCDIDREMVDDGGTNHSSDGDYADESGAASSQIGGRPRSLKRVRRTMDTEDDGVAVPATHSFDASNRAAAVASSGGMHTSEEIPIHGYLTLKTVESKVVYCLTFSQEVLPRPRRRGQRLTTDLGEPQSVAPDSRMRQAPLRRQSPHHPWTREEEATLREIKEGRSWDEIYAALPHRSKGALQVRYSTKLK
jgi:hypothetical protein